MQTTSFIAQLKNMQLKGDSPVVAKYNYWRWRIFYSMFVGYALFYFTRKSYNFVMPVMLDDLGYTKAQVGLLGTALYLSYGASKFVSGIMSEYSNPRYFMAIGLFITGVLNIWFGFTSSIFALAVVCFINGWFQGWGWPPCTKLLTYWYNRNERGIWWSLCSTSHGVGGMLIPILAAAVAINYGWRWGMHIPGIIAIAMAFWLFNRLRGIPESLDLPPVEEVAGRDDSSEVANTHSYDKRLSLYEIVFQEILLNKWVWLLAFSYFFVYVVRIGINDWAHIFLREVKGYSVIAANSSIFWYEIGGIVGMLLAGFGSDAFFRGNRLPVIVAYTLGLLVAIPLLWYSPKGYIFIDYIIMAGIGCLVFGPQMLVGLAVAEYVNKQAACSANGFAGLFGSLGSAAAAYPIGIIVDKWQWQGYFICLMVCTAVVLVTVLQVCTSKKLVVAEENST